MINDERRKNATSCSMFKLSNNIYENGLYEYTKLDKSRSNLRFSDNISKYNKLPIYKYNLLPIQSIGNRASINLAFLKQNRSKRGIQRKASIRQMKYLDTGREFKEFRSIKI